MWLGGECGADVSGALLIIPLMVCQLSSGQFRCKNRYRKTGTSNFGGGITLPCVFIHLSIYSFVYFCLFIYMFIYLFIYLFYKKYDNMAEHWTLHVTSIITDATPEQRTHLLTIFKRAGPTN